MEGTQEEEEDGDCKRQVALLLSGRVFSPHPSSCILLLQEYLCRGDGGFGHGLGVHNSGRGYGFSRPGFKFHSVYDSGAGLQEESKDRDGGIQYVELSQQDSRESTDQVRSGTMPSLGFPHLSLGL